MKVVEGFLHAPLLDPQKQVLKPPRPDDGIVLAWVEPPREKGAEARNRRVPAFAVRIPAPEVLGPLAR